LGEEEADPQDEERGTVAVPVPEAMRGRGSGWPQRPEQAPVMTHIGGSSCGRESLSVRVCTGNSDEHAAKHCAKSGREQAKARSLRRSLGRLHIFKITWGQPTMWLERILFGVFGFENKLCKDLSLRYTFKE